MPDFSPIPATTCEDAVLAQRPAALWPHDDSRPSLFRVHDPLQRRRAIMPLFLIRQDGDLQGLGTCFSIDPWGRFLTADHVVSGFLGGVPNGGVLAPLYSYGLMWGTRGFKMPDVFGVVRGAQNLTIPDDDPLNFLRAGEGRKPLDLTFLQVEAPSGRQVKTLPIRSRAAAPSVGETVVAIGFPEIETVVGQFDDVRSRLIEGMFAAYGRVTAIHVEGRDRSTPTPVFEVEANWPSGMSGAPVFNSNGEVVGVVSRALDPADGKEFGVGWAVLLAALPILDRFAPTLDDKRPEVRRCWVAYRPEPWSIGGAAASPEEAAKIAQSLGGDWRPIRGKWEVGTRNFEILVG